MKIGQELASEMHFLSRWNFFDFFLHILELSLSNIS